MRNLVAATVLCGALAGSVMVGAQALRSRGPSHQSFANDAVLSRSAWPSSVRDVPTAMVWTPAAFAGPT